MLQNNRFPFNSAVIPSSTALEPLNSPYSGDGSSALGANSFGIDPSKKKRGRPRKYSPEVGVGNIALGLTPTPPPISDAVVVQAEDGGTPSSEQNSKRHRGRPPSSGKRQLDALGNCGVGFTPHVILVKAGEDIGSKIMAFSQEGPRTVCVLSANGSVCNVTLHQPAMSNGTVTYEGRFEIISITGSFLFSENGGNNVRSGGLCVSLAGTDGRVLGGGVAGLLMAASPVQIIVGSFIADGKKPKYMPSIPDSRMMSFSAPPAIEGSPPSNGATSESSDENVDNHIDRTPVPYGNSSQAIHNMQQMYSPMGWGNSGPKMFQN